MRQRGSRRVRPRPNSRGNENLTSPISTTEPSSFFDQSNDISSGCSNVEERLSELPTSSDTPTHERRGVNERRTRSERYNSSVTIFLGRNLIFKFVKFKSKIFINFYWILKISNKSKKKVFEKFEEY